MKKIVIVLVILFALGTSSWAMMGGQKGEMGHGMMMSEGQQMPMMHMCQHMMKHNMMMQNMMQMMKDMLKMQEKMIKGMKPAEKKQMMMEMNKMMGKMDRMMSGMKGMMSEMMEMQTDVQQRLKCAEEQLKKAIDLHELHMKDPKTTTEASQMELMDQIKKAYECVKGTDETTPEKEGEKVEEPKKIEPHKH
ncbi:MAG: hypothetical protein HZC12_04775 [Nitrospirae bacterium]|nr:hypothetical protein [Nitrospirota bacterium]